jgi:hypothetical protein
VDYNDLFCDGNSKVWLINKMTVKGVNVVQQAHQKKELLVFHESGVVDYVSIQGLQGNTPKKGQYYLDSDKRELSITFEDEEWNFYLPLLKEDRVKMRPRKRGEAPFTLEIIPFPEV